MPIYVRHDSGRVLGESVNANPGFVEVTGTDTRTLPPTVANPFFFEVGSGNYRDSTKAERRAWELADRKQERLQEVDAKTSRIADAAADEAFQLPAKAVALAIKLLLWHTQPDLPASGPVKNAHDRLTAALNKIEAGDTVRDQIKAAATIAEVNAIADNRS